MFNQHSSYLSLLLQGNEYICILKAGPSIKKKNTDQTDQFDQSYIKNGSTNIGATENVGINLTAAVSEYQQVRNSVLENEMGSIFLRALLVSLMETDHEAMAGKVKAKQ